MNWKLIFSLSLFGLVMGIATVYFIPSTVEPFFWLVIFVICAYLIAENCSSKYFLHGLLVSIVNSVWITAAHTIFYNTYINSHQQEASLMAKTTLSVSPKLMMLLTGPVVGVVSGLVLGIFALIASGIMKKRPV